MIRVLVAEDTATTRQLLVDLLRSEPDVEVVGEARNGAEAVELTRTLHPSVITMDVRMAPLDGFEATRRIMQDVPTPIVIVSGSVDVRAVETSMKALGAGALALLPTPPGPGAPDFEFQRRRFVDTVRNTARLDVSRVRPEPVAGTPRTGATASHRVVAIAASTGGPVAIATLLAGLPADLPVPVLVVQHIAHGFGPGFAAWLDTCSPLRVKVARNGDALLPGTVHVAPDGQHLGITSSLTVQLSDAPPVDGARPSASHLFSSVANACGRAAIGVILTGMGKDGVDGLREMRRAGAVVLAQDEETSVVYGMPGAAVSAGVTSDSLPLARIAPRIRELLGRTGR